jgi:toxin ParE1/3/4
MNYQFHPAAANEYLESIAFYESRLKGLGADYVVEFESVMVQVCSAPLSYQLECPPEIHKAGLKRFPFNVLYRVSGNYVQILAIAHHRRRPGYWLGRMSVRL